MAGEAAIEMLANTRAANKKTSALKPKLNSVFHPPVCDLFRIVGEKYRR